MYKSIQTILNMFIIDVQGFSFPEENVFLCREITIFNIENKDYVHKFVKLPFTRKMMCSTVLNHINFTTNNIHGLEWDSWNQEDELNYEEISKFIQSYVLDESIFVANANIEKYLRNFIFNKIIVLENYPEMLSYDDCKVIFKSRQCNNHIPSRNIICALENVYFLYYWYEYCNNRKINKD